MSTTSTVIRAARPLDVIALQYANPTRMVTIPLVILGAVVVVTSAITVVTGETGSDSSILWSLLGFVVAIGVQAVAVSFPLALALGSTRRTFTTGVLLTAGLEAALLTAASVVLLGLELVTGGWFVGARVVSGATLGDGNAVVLMEVMFLTTLSASAVGGLFGAAWVRFGARGPLVLGLALSAAFVVALLVLAPSFGSLAEAFEAWWLVIAAVAVVAVSTVGVYLLLRRAAVR